MCFKYFVKINAAIFVSCMMSIMSCVQEGTDGGNSFPKTTESPDFSKVPSENKTPFKPAPKKKKPSPEQQLVPGRPETCADVMAQFKEPENFILSAQEFKQRFTLKKDLRGVSKSGAFPSIVLSKTDNTIKFLKIFPKITKGLKSAYITEDPGYLEIFQSCRLAQLNLTANLPHDVEARRFFVDVYEIGFLKTDDPFIKADQDGGYYPYLLGEAIDAVTLTKFATEPSEVAKPDNIGFDLDTAPKMVLESILLQIIVALKNPYLAWRLVHNDLHTGNILISKHEKADFTIDFEGKKMKLAGPLVKIIDFGLGESEGFLQKNTFNFSLWIKNRPVIKELEEFIRAVGHGKGISLFSRLKIGRTSINQDIYMFNLILSALQSKLNSRGSHLENGRYCSDYDDCIKLMSTWWK